MIEHLGYKFRCDVPACTATVELDFARTERTAIYHVRLLRWFVGRVRVTSGIRPARSVRTVTRALCPCHSHLVGA